MTRSDMQLLSVNVARSRLIVHHGNRYTTGIFKQPVTGRVMLRRINLQGDQQADRSVHGGPDKAVYVYPFEHYAYWAERLGRDDFTYGQFGENFTAMGVTEDVMHIGDVLRIGGAVVQVTQVRVPCYKLANKLGIAGLIAAN